MSTPSIRFGIVIPTRNEPPKLVADLVAEIHGYLPRAEVLIVDDSDADHWDGFHQAMNLMRAPATSVQMRHREGSTRWGKLAGAVVHGARWFSGQGVDFIAFMDGDGQHDPAALPEMYAALLAGYDIAVGTRYSLGGSPGTGLSPLRRLMSKGCHLLARTCLPFRTRGLHDTMSGFAALNLETVNAQSLWADRFKVLLQILAQNPGVRSTEVPYTFRDRLDGESKAGVDEALAYLACLVKLMKLAYIRPYQAPALDERPAYAR